MEHCSTMLCPATTVTLTRGTSKLGSGAMPTHRHKFTTSSPSSLSSLNVPLTTLCLEKVHPLYFYDYSIKCWPILTIFGIVAAEKICNQMTYSFLIMSSLCMNITEMKNKRDYVWFQCCRFICSHRASFWQLVQKFVQSLQSPNLYLEIL